MKFRWLFVVLLLLAPTLALAQDDGVVSLTGDYAYEGGSGDGAYSGTVTLSGTGPVYWLNYIDEAGEESEDSGEAPALAQGTIVASAFGEACAPATLVRQSDGGLFGLWIDSNNEVSTSVGMEYAQPQSETTDFAGVYDVIGTDANGSQYLATLTITHHEGGWYDLNYSYTSDENVIGDTSEEFGIGIAAGDVLGYAYGEVAGECSPYLLDLAGGAFSAWYLDGNGGIATETGSRVE